MKICGHCVFCPTKVPRPFKCINIIIILGSYIALCITPLRVETKRSVFSMQGMWGQVFEVWYYLIAPCKLFYKVLWCNMLPIKPGTPRRTPTLLIYALSSLLCITQHTGAHSGWASIRGSAQKISTHGIVFNRHSSLFNHNFSDFSRVNKIR